VESVTIIVILVVPHVSQLYLTIVLLFCIAYFESYIDHNASFLLVRGRKVELGVLLRRAL